MDYYTYQKQFPENLNQFISQQYATNVNTEYATNVNTEYANVNNEYATNVNTEYVTNVNNELLNYQYAVSQPMYPPYTIPPAPVIVPQVYDLSFPPSPVLNLETKTDDELWIETWLSKIGKIQINLNSTIELDSVTKPTVKQVKSDIQLHAVKTTLANCILQLDKLEQTHEHLKINVAEMPAMDWNINTMEISSTKAQFSKLMSQFERPGTVAQLQMAVERRRKKRFAQKRRKKNRSDCISEMLENRQKLHKAIDQWLEAMKDEVERTKIEESMKKEADCVLAEVTKKKSDARKLLSLISSLVKLRYVREQTAVQRGENVSPEDAAAFTKATERLTKIWNDALNVYSKEEQGLRMMLEETAVEDNNAARIAKERKITQEWDCVLFGPKRIPLPAYWGLMAAEKDLETFITIRKAWDTFLTNDNGETGSSIPIGWVKPNSNPQQNWIKYLDTF